MTMKELTTLMPKAKSGDLRILVRRGKVVVLSVIPSKEIEDRINAFEKRASLEKADRKNQESHGSIRLWSSDLLEATNAGKASMALLPSAALWMSLRHWKHGDRHAKSLKDMMARKQSPHLTIQIREGANDAEKIAENAWSFALGENFLIEEETLASLSRDDVRIAAAL